jgi:DNA repair exonuclease SbcCD ATPase subunit
MNTLRSLKRLIGYGVATALVSTTAFAISSEKLAELKAKAEAGNGISQYNLGLVYADPQEPIGSILEAYVWFSLAADNGAPGKALMIVTNQLTPEQLSEGKKLLEQRRADLAAHRHPIVVAATTPKTPDADPVKPATITSPVIASPVAAAPVEPDTTAIQAELKKASDALAVATKENQQLKTQLDKTQVQQTELDQTKQERDKLTTTVTTYTNEISTMRAAAANFEGERNALQQKIVDATKQSKDSVAAELAATTAKLKAAESELTKADVTNAELVTTKQSLATLNEQLQKTTGENQRLTSLVKQTETAADEKAAVSEKMLNEVNGELLKSRASLSEATGKASIVAASATAENTALRQNNTELSNQLQKLTQEKDQALAQVSKGASESQQQIDALTSKLKSSDAAFGKASAEQADLAQQLAAVKAAPPKQDPEILARLTKVTADLEAVQLAAASEKEVLSAKLKTAQESLAKASAEQADLAQQLATAKAAPAKADPETEARIAKLFADLETAQLTAASEKEALSAKLKTAEEALANSSAEKTDVAQQLAALKAASSKPDPEAQAQLAKISAELETVQRTAVSDKETLSAKLKVAEESLTASANNQTELAQLKAKLETLRDENAKGQSSASELVNRTKENADLQAKLKSSENALAAATAERAELEQKFKAAKPSKKEAAALAKIDELKAELETTRAEAAKGQAGATELDSAHKEIADLQAKLKSSEEALATAKSAPAPVIASENPTPAVAVTPEAASSDVQKELYEAQLKLDASLRSYQLQQNEIERLQNALSNIDNERAKLAERLQAATSEVTSINNKAAANNDATAQLAGVREQLRQTQNQLASIAYENTELKHRIAFMAPTQGNITPLPVSAPTVSYNTPNRPGTNRPAPTEPATTPAAAAPRTHTVASGETLSTIAKRYYGSASRWTEILEANKSTLRDPTALRAGMKIKIP